MTSRCQGLFQPHPFFEGKALGTSLFLSVSSLAKSLLLILDIIEAYKLFSSRQAVNCYPLSLSRLTYENNKSAESLAKVSHMYGTNVKAVIERHEFL